MKIKPQIVFTFFGPPWGGQSNLGLCERNEVFDLVRNGVLRTEEKFYRHYKQRNQNVTENEQEGV